MKSALFAVNLIFMISTPFISYLFKNHYPRDVNHLFGYRTKRSMASKEAWVLANSYSAKLLFAYSWPVVGLQIILLFLFDTKVALLVSASLWLASLFAVIVQTELKLKEALKKGAE
jgi:uncharacterized membrane protein